MPKATLILHRKRIYDDGAVSEVKIWQVPLPVRRSTHVFKYSLFYGEHGLRLVGYDNEAGKGDHRHYGDHEQAYVFTSFTQLLADFVEDVRALREGDL